MKYKIFDVIETKKGDKGTIVETLDNKMYKVNLIQDKQEKTVKVSEKDILNIVYKK